MTFPKYIQDQLDGPSPGAGGRHEALMKTALQMVGERIHDEEIFSALRQWVPDKDKTNSEINTLIRGAHKLNPQPAAGAQRTEYREHRKPEPKRNRYKVVDSTTSDVPTCDLPLAEFLKIAYAPGETVCITKTSELREGKWTISAKGTFLTVEQWIEKIGDRPKFFDGEPGAWIRLNPFQPDKFNGTDAEVASYRHVLVEFDTRPLAEQWQILKNCGLPITCVIYSGNDSLHAWVRVDAADADEYKRRQERVYDYLADVMDDVGNKNPSRWSRLPGAMRGEVLQRLVAVNIGTPDYETWDTGLELPALIPLADLRSFDRTADPNNMIGNRWLTKGSSLIIQGASGIGKSSLLMQMEIAWALGQPIFGLRPVQCMRCVTIEAENDLGDLAEPFQDMTAALGLSDDDHAKLDANLSFFRESAKTGQEFMSAVRALIKRHKPDIVFADPLFAYVGGDASKQETMSQFLRNWLQPILMETGVIWIWLHHVSKPKLSRDAKTATKSERKYAGFGSVELTNWAREVMTLTEVDDRPSVFEVDFGKRGNRRDSNEPLFIQHSASGIKWDLAPAPGFVYVKRADGSDSYRERYSDMPPLHHHANPFKSEVVAWIIKAEKERGEVIDHEEADRRREVARQSKPKIWNFCNRTRLWQGVNYSTP